MKGKKLMLNILIVGMIFLCLEGSIAQSIEMAPGTPIKTPTEQDNILIYTTWCWPWDGWPKEDWLSLGELLQEQDFLVTITDRNETPTLTATLLNNYTELWIIDTAETQEGLFTPEEITAILAFHQQGYGMLLSAGEINPYGWGHANTVNQIATPLGVSFYGQMNLINDMITPIFSPHPLFAGMTTIYGGSDASYLQITSPATSVATYQSQDLIAIRDDQPGKVVFDNSVRRFINAVLSHGGDNTRYVYNIADWLAVPENQPPDAPSIIGPTTGKTNIELTYNFTVTDPEGDDVYLFVDWGDGTNTSWVGTYPSGTVIMKSHTWTKKGAYQIKAQGSDIYGYPSEWTTLPISIPYSYNLPTRPFLVKLFEHFPHAFPILRHLMRY